MLDVRLNNTHTTHTYLNLGYHRFFTQIHDIFIIVHISPPLKSMRFSSWPILCPSPHIIGLTLILFVTIQEKCYQNLHFTQNFVVDQMHLT